jgi:TrmH family RNA methyltransferase
LPIREIISSSNRYIKEYRRLAGNRKYRRAAGKLAVEGPNAVKEALSAGLAPEVVFFTRNFIDDGGTAILSCLPGGSRQYLVNSSLFARLADTETPQEIAAIIPFGAPELSSVMARPLSLVLILDSLRDPGNMGTIVRTAAAAGVDALFFGPGTVDPYSPKALRASAGAIFHLPPVAVEEPLRLLKLLQSGGMLVLAAQPQGGRLYWEMDLRGKTAFLIGGESGGLSPELAAAADLDVTIPQLAPLDSLNAAVAAAVLVYEVLRQRSG